MARRSVTDELEYQVDPEEQEQPVEREKPVRRAKPSRDSGSRRRINLVYWAVPFAALVAVVVLTFAFHRVESFLINDARFHLAGPADYSQDSPNLQVSGLKRASKAEILKVFEKDFGRSLYLFPVAERRRNLLAIDWVRDGVVSRRWPDQIYVQVTERQPVAFVQFNHPDKPPTFRLIDADGVLLPAPKGERFDLVVLTGVGSNETEDSRRIRVRQAVALLGELGSNASKISEIDVSDPANLEAVVQLDKEVVTLRVGARNFAARIENFTSHFRRIHEQRPGARLFDLRVDGRITAIEDHISSPVSIPAAEIKPATPAPKPADGKPTTLQLPPPPEVIQQAAAAQPIPPPPPEGGSSVNPE